MEISADEDEYFSCVYIDREQLWSLHIRVGEYPLLLELPQLAQRSPPDHSSWSQDVCGRELHSVDTRAEILFLCSLIDT